MQPSRRLAEHFESLAKQDYAARLGMWVFLASEAMLFGGLLALYAAYRRMYPSAFAEAVAHNTLAYGTINTYVLVTSSFTVALGVHALRTERSRRALLAVMGTIALGSLFLVFKGFEYSDHFAHGIYPGGMYRYHELTTRGAAIFFTLYYFLTGLHALHVTVGLCVLSWLAIGIARRRVRPDRTVPLELGALYWHLVDVVWLFLWPMLYLMR